MAKKEEVKKDILEEVKAPAAPQVSLKDQIFDMENNDNVVLQDENGNTIEFYQVAMIPHLLKNYVILKPTEKVEGIGEDEAVVFLVKDVPDNDDIYLEVVQDEDLIDTVFGKFEDMLEEEEDFIPEKPTPAKKAPAKKTAPKAAPTK